MSHRTQEGLQRGFPIDKAKELGHGDIQAVSPFAGGTGYYSVQDGHELAEQELAASNMVIGGDGFVYQPILGEGPFAGDIVGFDLAPQWVQEEVLGFGDAGGGGRTGPTTAELAIERSKVQSQNLSTFIDSTINQISAEIEAGRLKTDQAVAEFNRRLDAFSEAGTQFQGIQQYTIPIGAEYAPGFQPGGIGERLGIEPRPAEVIMYDPFQMAADIVAGTPNIADIGVPETDLLGEAVEIAQGFL